MEQRLPPKLTLVVHNDESALQRRAALSHLDWTTRRLVPNFLAVIEGAGRPQEMIEQFLSIAAAIGEVDGFSGDQAVAAEIQAVIQAALRQSVDRASCVG